MCGMSRQGSAWGIIAVFLFVPLLSYAQVALTGLERPLDLKMTPEHPAAGDTVTLTVSSYGVDLERSQIVWYADKKEMARGTALTSTTVDAGTLGSAKEITVIAEETDGLIGSATATVRPTEVDLLWESDSYSPPYFRGRTLSGTNATIRAQAVVRFIRADGSTIPEEDIIYSWYKGTTRILSGRGKSSMITTGPSLFGNETLAVAAESADGLYHGRASVNITGVDPNIELYENHPLFGVLYHRALLNDATTLESELRVSAVPYFAHVTAPQDSSLVYEWRHGTTDITPDPKHPETLTINAQGYQGTATIDLRLTSLTDLFLRASGAWNITFSDANPFFGSDPFARPQ